MDMEALARVVAELQKLVVMGDDTPAEPKAADKAADEAASAATDEQAEHAAANAEKMVDGGATTEELKAADTRGEGAPAGVIPVSPEPAAIIEAMTPATAPMAGVADSAAAIAGQNARTLAEVVSTVADLKSALLELSARVDGMGKLISIVDESANARLDVLAEAPSFDALVQASLTRGVR